MRTQTPQQFDAPTGVAVIVTTYQRPTNLRFVLTSIARQQGVSEPLEVVVADDGSTDDTEQIVREFAKSASFPVSFTTHPHHGFRVGRSRNEGVAASGAPYLVFVDGDCVLPPDYLRSHLNYRRPHVVWTGDAARLTKEQTAELSLRRVAAGDFWKLVSPSERRRLHQSWLKSHFYRWTGSSNKPRLYGGGVGIWREDYLRINGYDENFEGWGCEDDDLRHRLGLAGVQVRCLPGKTYTVHAWHEPHPSCPSRWKLGANVGYHLRRGKLRRCTNGIHKRRPQDIVIQLTGAEPGADLPVRLPPGYEFSTPSRSSHADIEVLAWPAARRFVSDADCKVLLNLQATPASARIAAQSDHIVGARDERSGNHGRQLPLHQFERLIRGILGRAEAFLLDSSDSTGQCGSPAVCATAKPTTAATPVPIL